MYVTHQPDNAAALGPRRVSPNSPCSLSEVGALSGNRKGITFVVLVRGNATDERRGYEAGRYPI